MSIVGGPGRVEITTGRTGNPLDPTRPVALSRLELSGRNDRVALRASWPVAEVLTNRAVQVLDDLAGELRAADDPDPTATIADVVRFVRGESSDVADPACRLLAGAYPLLAPPLAAGARPGRVPVALEPLLRHDTPRDAARAALRPTATTRPLVRALARSLMPDADGVIAWERPLLALMAAPRCGPEQLVSILSAPVHHPAAMSFSVTEVQRARWMLAERHPRRVAETLIAALGQPEGTAELAREIAAFVDRPPPPPPAAEPAPRARPRPEPDLNRAPIEYPRAIALLCDATVDGLRVCLPRVPDDLLEWGVAMSNCLGAYRGPVARGHTTIIGFARGPDLEAVAEVSRAKVLRQLEAPGNTAPSPQRSSLIVEFLRAHRVVEADGRR